MYPVHSMVKKQQNIFKKTTTTTKRIRITHTTPLPLCQHRPLQSINQSEK